MHPLFRLTELLNIILQNLIQDDVGGRSTIAAVARTCKTFEETALDILWQEQDSLVPLLRCISESIEERATPGAIDIPGYPRSKTIYAVKPVSLPNGERLHKYSTRIKSFRFWCGRDRQYIDRSALVALFADCRLHFPNLQILDWPLLGIRQKDHQFAVKFLGPKLEVIVFKHIMEMSLLETVRLIRPPLLHFQLSKPLGGDTLVSLRNLLSAIPALRSFSCSLRSPSPGLWADLSRLPLLATLNLTIERKYILPTSLGSCIENIFPSLDCLRFTVDDISDVTFLLGLGIFPKLQSISITFASMKLPTGNPFSPLIDAITRRCSHQLFHSMEFEFQPESSEVDNDQECIHPDTFRPLFAFSVTKFVVTRHWCYDIDDAFLQDIALAWPNLEYLSLQPLSFTRGEDLALSEVTLEGLLPLLTHCPKLRHITAHVHADPPAPSVSNRPGGGRVSASLEELYIGSSTITSAAKTAAFLSAICTDRVYVGAWERSSQFANDENGTRWSEVVELVEYFQTVRAQEREWAHDENANSKELLT